MSMGMLNKVCVCICCHPAACGAGQFIDCYHSIESCCLAELQCGACCWTMCAPICHSCKCGDTGRACDHCKKGVKLCLYSCALSCIAPIDGCINCVLYIRDICSSGVTGFADVIKNKEFLAQKVKNACDLTNGPQPVKTFGTYSP